MYSLPLGVRGRFWWNGATSATPLAQTIVNLVGAPGAGKRIRLQAFYITNTSPNGYAFGDLADGVALRYLPWAVGAAASYAPVIPEPGILLDTSNAPLQLILNGSLASLVVTVEVYFCIESGY